MKHVKLFESMTQGTGRFPSVREYFSIDADNTPAQIAFVKKKADLNDPNDAMINADYIVRGANSLLSGIDKAGLDSRYGGAIKEAMESLKPALAKIQEIQYPSEK